MKTSRLAALLSISAMGLAVPRSALADEKEACLAASDSGQDQKLHGSLRAARQQFLICARDVCPLIVKQDCSQWLAEVMAALPTVVIGAHDWQGHDLVDVTVSVDGSVATRKLDGKPIGVDPGPHTFHYESTTGAPPVEERVLIRQGETNRPLTITFDAPPGAIPTPAPVPEQPPPPPPPSSARSPLAYVFGGLGVVAIGAGAVLGLSANGDASTAREAPPTGCKPNCPQSRVDAIETKYVVADVSFGVGIVSLGLAAYFFFSHRGEAAPDSKRGSVSFDITAAPNGASGGLAGVAGSF